MQESSQVVATTEPVAAVPGIAEAIGSMPAPQEHAIEEAQRQSAEAAAEATAPVAPNGARVDSHGVTFDPALHSGTLTPTGHWRKKKTPSISRVGTSATAGQKPGSVATQTEAEKRALLVSQSNAAGAAAAESIIALCRALGGDDFNPIKSTSEDERAALHDAWAQYFLATGKTFSPGWLLVAANGGYIARRTTMPKTQSRIQRVKEKLAAWVARRRMRKNRATHGTEEMSIDGTE